MMLDVLRYPCIHSPSPSIRNLDILPSLLLHLPLVFPESRPMSFFWGGRYGSSLDKQDVVWPKCSLTRKHYKNELYPNADIIGRISGRELYYPPGDSNANGLSCTWTSPLGVVQKSCIRGPGVTYGNDCNVAVRCCSVHWFQCRPKRLGSKQSLSWLDWRATSSWATCIRGWSTMTLMARRRDHPLNRRSAIDGGNSGPGTWKPTPAHTGTLSARTRGQQRWVCRMDTGTLSSSSLTTILNHLPPNPVCDSHSALPSKPPIIGPFEEPAMSMRKCGVKALSQNHSRSRMPIV